MQGLSEVVKAEAFQQGALTLITLVQEVSARPTAGFLTVPSADLPLKTVLLIIDQAAHAQLTRHHALLSREDAQLTLRREPHPHQAGHIALLLALQAASEEVEAALAEVEAVSVEVDVAAASEEAAVAEAASVEAADAEADADNHRKIRCSPKSLFQGLISS